MTGILIIDKPSGWTSHDVVGKLRGVLRERRIGHGGTLDPMATGVLPVFIGRATRAVEFFESADKEYIAGLRLGIVTDTQDTTGTILETHDANVSQEELRHVLRCFIGRQEQIPPMYSAVKVGGQKLYQLARKGVEIERQAKNISVSGIEILDCIEDGFLLRIVCSKGTYVRTLCHDIGGRLGCGGAMSSLRRTRAGVFHIDEAVSIDDVAASAQTGGATQLIKPVDSLFRDYPAICLNDEQVQKCRNGAAFGLSGRENGLYRVYDKAGGFLMLGRQEDGLMRTVKSFYEV
jgi:tRNA pseudouridine55 synthase